MIDRGGGPSRGQRIARSVVIATGAALLYGGWALHANFDHGWLVAGRAGATQGVASFTITLLMTGAMELLHRTARSPWSQFVRAAGGSIALSGGYTIGLHWLMGTPELLRTVAPSLAIGGVYSIVYSARLVRESSRLRAEG